MPLTRFMKVVLYSATVLAWGIGVPLLVFSDYTDVFFVWPVHPPFSAAFLGAAYVAGGTLELVAVRSGRWDAARIAVPGVFAFTVATAIVSVQSGIADDLMRPAAAVWLATYAIFGPALALAWLLQVRRGEPDASDRVSHRVRALFGSLGLALSGLGLALMVVPEAAGRIWPWDLSPPDVYSTDATMEPYIGAWLLGLGVTSLFACIHGTRAGMRPLAFGGLAFCFAQLLILPRGASVIDFGSPGTWAYTAVLLTIGALSAISLRAMGTKPVTD